MSIKVNNLKKAIEVLKVKQKATKFLKERPRSADSPWSKVSNKYGVHMKVYQKNLIVDMMDDYIKKFASSSREVKNKILDMGHRSLRDIDQGLKSDGTSLAKQYSQDVNEVIIALDVRHTNAFSFGTSGKASLFWCACKANHSW